MATTTGSKRASASGRSSRSNLLDSSQSGDSAAPLPRDYHEVEFRIIPPHGGNGERSAPYNFSGPPQYKRIIELLYSHPLTPWKTENDVLRAFLDLGCRHFGDAIGGHIIPGVLHQLEMMNALIERAREMNNFAESIDTLDREAQRLIDGGMRESAVGLVYQYREQAKAIPDKILKRKLVGDINQRFGHLLKGAQGRRDTERAAGIADVDEDERYEGHEDHGDPEDHEDHEGNS